ncbi:ABC transporter substrate-binding protein [Aeromicrobium sp. Leaf350]|uniref:ABC transporter substrate-binding protein n=1 Tax=Aeromicrobium sp. Leaf350 TaxID=2876565 RepID=UPI001E3B0C48|nr:ABC transporter substrate-binding protein [Aeromicrobium sp. Leaf350]
MRVVSLLPSATEIVYALGAQDRLVGVTFECDEPASARADHRVIVSGRDTSAMDVAAIDAYVRAELAAGRDLYTLDEGAMADLAPDVILTQDLCRVCAVPTGQVDAALTHLQCRADVVTLDPMTLDDVVASVLTVGDALGSTDEARLVTTRLRERLAAVAAAVARRPHPRAAVVEWVDPLFTGGHWIPDQVAAAGGIPVGMHAGTASGPGSWDALAATEPEVVLVAPCGYGLEGAAEQAEVVARHLPSAQVWAIDGNAVVVRPGPRVVDGVEAIASVLHPGAVAASDLVRRIS